MNEGIAPLALEADLLSVGGKMKERPRGLFYCRYLVGMGHLARSLNICRSLIKHFDIDFLVGGYDTHLSLESPHFRQSFLPYVSPEDLTALAENKHPDSQQKIPLLPEKILENINSRYDFFITEQFPFSKLEFTDEVEGIIHKIKTLNPDCLIISSLKDSTPLRPTFNEGRTLEFLQQYYDYIFVHADPRIYRLEESFSFANKIAEKVVYTGFVTNPDLEITPKERKKRIVVSIGAGSFGEELLYAAIEVAPFFLDYEFSLIVGPRTANKTLKELKILAQKAGAENVTILPPVKNFEEYLSESILSISLGGYTIVDAVSTKTPAIVYPSHFHDQYARGIKFSAFGFLKLIGAEELATERFSNIIREALTMSPSSFDVDVSGSQTTCKEIEKFLTF